MQLTGNSVRKSIIFQPAAMAESAKARVVMQEVGVGIPEVSESVIIT